MTHQAAGTDVPRASAGMNEKQRAELVAAVNAGDADALQGLMVHYHAVLHEVVAGRLPAALRPHVQPEDVLQDAYAAAFEALKQPSTVSLQPLTGSGPVKGQPSASGAESPAPCAGPPRFDHAGHFYKWLEQIALNRLRDIERALRSRKRDVGRRATLGGRDARTSCLNLIERVGATDSTPSQRLAQDEAIAAALSSLARLKPDQRAVVRLRILEDIPVAEIAQRLGKTETAVYTLCHRGLKALRERMASLTRYLTQL